MSEALSFTWYITQLQRSQQPLGLGSSQRNTAWCPSVCSLSARCFWRIVGDDDGGTLFTPEQYEAYKKKMVPLRLRNRLYVSYGVPGGRDCKVVGPDTPCFCTHRFCITHKAISSPCRPTHSLMYIDARVQVQAAPDRLRGGSYRAPPVFALPGPRLQVHCLQLRASVLVHACTVQVQTPATRPQRGRCTSVQEMWVSWRPFTQRNKEKEKRKLLQFSFLFLFYLSGISCTAFRSTFTCTCTQPSSSHRTLVSHKYFQDQ